jgi:hypothetical protein
MIHGASGTGAIVMAGGSDGVLVFVVYPKGSASKIIPVFL